MDDVSVRGVERPAMKIAYISGGPLTMKASHIQVVEMCRALANLGHDVALYLGVSSSPTAPASLFPEWLDVPFEVRPFCSPEQGVGRLAPCTIQMLFRLWHERRCLVYVRESDLRVGLLTGLLGIACVIELHRPPRSRLHRVVLTVMQRLPWCQVVVISHALKDLCVRRYGMAPDKILVAHDAVALDMFQRPLSVIDARAALQLPVDGKMVVYAGGLQPGRGLEELLLACQGVARLLIVGGAADEVERFRLFAHEHGVQDVEYTGFVPHVDIPIYLYAADVLAMPYTAATQTRAGIMTSDFMSPLKLYEYMAARRPILATNLPVLREVLRHKDNAFLVEPGSVADLNVGLRALLRDEVLARSIARQARQDVETLTWENRARTIVESVSTPLVRRMVSPSPA